MVEYFLSFWFLGDIASIVHKERIKSPSGSVSTPSCTPWMVKLISDLFLSRGLTLQSKLALTGRRIDEFSKLCCLFLSEAVEANRCYFFENLLMELKCTNLLKPQGTIVHYKYHVAKANLFCHLQCEIPIVVYQFWCCWLSLYLWNYRQSQISSSNQLGVVKHFIVL